MKETPPIVYSAWNPMLKVYLDNCCFNRPFDLSTESKVLRETEAKLFIQSLIKYGDILLVSSFVLFSEIVENPSEYKRDSILQFIDKYAQEHVGNETKPEILEIAIGIMETGIKSFDAAHIACAISAKCDYFITTDKRILKYKTDRIQLLNPIEFVKIWRNLK